MRVEPNRVNRIKTDFHINKYINNTKPISTSYDSLEISSEAKALMDCISLVKTKKIEDIKDRIENGTYKISSLDVAEKILKDIETYNNMKLKGK